ncbi:hypothetical protein H181DRAFT_00967 [Streptomyces sp. WMMB 714]|uniref:hypothetical protein n=1 Tax=Streptomyces sp. WMMB 714 TaxID=1286822 RepID=UPI000823C509|nr:hypothetical protein [Streptomyces sp. WMMB 714]SCK14702.1 hypothetical protein H181DRAFT_00967 [Streptomyces sp. WMMB 714]
MDADETPRTDPTGSGPHIRLHVDLVVEIADSRALTRSALARVEGDELMPDEEREHARESVAGDAGEAIAYLVDPFDLVRELPGVELAHASWGSEEVRQDGLGAIPPFGDLDDDMDGDLEDDVDGEPEQDPGEDGGIREAVDAAGYASGGHRG